MEDFSALFASLEEEGIAEDVFCDDIDSDLLAEGEDNNARSLVGRIISTKHVSRDAVIGMAGSYWKVQGKYEIEVFGNNIFCFGLPYLQIEREFLRVAHGSLMVAFWFLKNLMHSRTQQIRSLTWLSFGSRSTRFPCFV